MVTVRWFQTGSEMDVCLFFIQKNLLLEEKRKNSQFNKICVLNRIIIKIIKIKKNNNNHSHSSPTGAVGFEPYGGSA